MKKIALSREQMEKLGCLGIDVSNASMCRDYKGDLMLGNSSDYVSREDGLYPITDVFTLQDIMEMLDRKSVV